MQKKTNFIFSKSCFKKNLKFYSFIVLVFSVISGERTQADSTFFPEDENLTETKAESPETEASAAIKKWAELNPPKQKMETLAPSPQEEQAEAKPLESQSLALEKIATEQPSQSASTAHPADTAALPADMAAPPVDTAADTAALPVDIPSAAEKQQPLQLSTVQPHVKPQPILEKEQTSLAQQTPQPSQKRVSYADAANDRVPLAILEPTQEVHNQRWSLYAAAIRGLKNPSDVVHIVTMQGCSPDRGEKVKQSLLDDDIAKDKIAVIPANGEPHQAGFVYIFAGK